MSSNSPCRVCTQDKSVDQMVDIFETNDHRHTIAEVIIELTGLKVKENDGLPSLCCVQCQSDLTTSITIRRKCIYSDNIMRTLLQSAVVKTEIHEYMDLDHLKQDDSEIEAVDTNYENAELVQPSEISFAVDNYKLNIEPPRTLNSNHPNSRATETRIDKATAPDETDEMIQQRLSVHSPDINDSMVANDGYKEFGVSKAHTSNSPSENPGDSLDGTEEQSSASEEFESKQCSICKTHFSDFSSLQEHAAKCNNDETDRQEDSTSESGEFCFVGLPATRLVKVSNRIAIAPEALNHDEAMGCCKCTRTFQSETELMEHGKLVHAPNAAPTSEIKPFQCNICYAWFKTEFNVRCHQMTMRKRSFKCPTCGMLFRTRTDFVRHKNKHDKALIFPCKYCAKRFVSLYKRSAHEKICNNQEQLQETMCKNQKQTHETICNKDAKTQETIYNKEEQTQEIICKYKEQTQEKICNNQEQAQEIMCKNQKQTHETISHKDSKTQETICKLQKQTQEKVCNNQVKTQETICKVQKQTQEKICNNQVKTQKTICKLQKTPVLKSAMLGSKFRYAVSDNEIIDASSFNHVCCGCGTTFDTEDAMMQHANHVHAPNAPLADTSNSFKCNICYRWYKTEGDLRDHKIKMRPKKYKCVTCEAQFDRPSSLVRHKSKHTKEPALPCKFCGKLFVTLRMKIKHQQNEHILKRPNNSTCCGCGSDFGTKDELMQHAQTVHAPLAVVDLTRPFRCDICYKLFTTESKLLHHQVAPSRFQCTTCGKMFSRRASLTTHELMHNTEGYKCRQCGQTFHNSYARTKHVRSTHSAQGPEGSANHVCPTCGKTYTTADYLKIHMLLHDEPKFKCHCGAEFKMKRYLSDHMTLAHSSRHTCRFCQATFRCASLLKGHENGHIGLKEYFCSVCNEGFYSQKQLGKHRVKWHGPKSHLKKRNQAKK